MKDDKKLDRPQVGEVHLSARPPQDFPEEVDLTTSLPSAAAALTDDENKLVGNVIMDRYLVQSIAGRGGMSVVYKAQHLLLRRPIALKTLHKQLSQEMSHIQRFKVEAQAASKLAHENIVSIYDFGTLDNGCAFLAMEFVEGKQLAESIEQDKQFKLERAIDLTLQCCSALQHAHENGIIHRDLKPTNVIVCNTEKGESVKIVDFGIAKVFENDQNLTRTGETLGSPPYMSPEQCRGDDTLDARSDVYSLGCLFYEMLCAQAPLQGGTIYETIHKQISEMPPSISQSRNDIKAVSEVDALILTALAKNPQARFQTMAEFKDALLTLKQQACGAGSAKEKLAASWRVFVRRYVAGAQHNYKPLKIALSVAAVGLIGAAAWQFTKAPAVAPADVNPSFIGDTETQQSGSYDKVFATKMQIARSLIDQGKPAIPELEQACSAGLTAFGEQDSRYLKALKLLEAQYTSANQTAKAARVATEINRIDRFLTPLGDPLSNGSKIQELILALQSSPNNKATLHELAVTLTNQSELLSAAGRHKEAQSNVQQALSILQKNFPDDSLNVRAHVLNGRQYRMLGRFDLASPEYLKVSAFASSPKSSAAMSGYASLALGENAFWERKFPQAANYYSDAIKKFQAYYKGPSPQEADTTELLAKTQAFLGNSKEAVRLMEKSIEMSRLVEGPQNHTLGKRTANLGWIYFKNKDWANSEATIKKAMQMLYANSWGDNLTVARAAAVLGHVYYFQKKYDLAEPYLKQSVVLFARNDRHDEKDFYKGAPSEFLDSSRALMTIYKEQNRPKDVTKLGDLVRRARADSQAQK